MASYTYIFADLLTNNILAELPLKNVSFTSVLNGAGPFQGDLVLSDPKVQALPWGLVQEGRTTIYVGRDNSLVWGGVLWTAKWDSDTHALTLGGNEFPSFYHAGRLSADQSFTNADQCDVVRAILNWDKARAGRDIGMQLSTTTSGVLVTVAWNGYDLKTILDVVNQIQQLPNGIDYSVSVAWNAGVPTKTFNIGYPRLGNLAINTGLIFETTKGSSQGNIVKYVWPRDASKMADGVWAIGSGSGPGLLRTEATDPSLVGGGWPLLEDTVSHKSITDPVMLAAYAQGDVALRNYPVVVPQVYIRPDLDPVLGSWQQGDDARFRILDEYFPAPGLDAYYRIISTQVKPGDDAPEEIMLTLGLA